MYQGCWILPFFISALHVCTADPNSRKLMFDLFTKSEIDPEVRPVVKHSRNVTVHLGTSLQEVEEIDDSTGQMGYRIILSMWWNDYQLQWNPSDYGGVDKIFISPERIWTPDIDMYNSKETSRNNNVRAVVYSDGNVLWMPPGHYKSSCSHEFRSDSWLCELIFRSWVFSASDMDIKPFEGSANMNIDEVRPSAHYSVIAAEGERSLASYQCCDEPFAQITVMLRVRNHMGHPAILGKKKRSPPDRPQPSDDLF